MAYSVCVHTPADFRTLSFSTKNASLSFCILRSSCCSTLCSLAHILLSDPCHLFPGYCLHCYPSQDRPDLCTDLITVHRSLTAVQRSRSARELPYHWHPATAEISHYSEAEVDVIWLWWLRPLHAVIVEILQRHIVTLKNTVSLVNI